MTDTWRRIEGPPQGAISLFDREFVQSGLLSREASRTLHLVFNARQSDDHRRLDPVTPEEAGEALAMAEGFVESVRTYLASSGWLVASEARPPE